ncbi:hypothetical protein D3C76_1031210 [compost metagenome]|uniref:Putative membrane protein n=1 Tax=Pseudomonas jinjuensis TaxID=198616 RepID=A0A1H0NI29_9PSED|nr:DUF2214 family protein [Pseudomonas jinjuensis]SDO92427.1 putative membrane protein [Pseudomonas jinjuensis]
MAAAIAAYLHFISIFMLFALLALEHHLFRLPLDLQRARSLVIVDLAYGLFAGLVLLTGVARAIWFAKGPEYYLYNGLFITKVGLFILVGLLSSYPTFTYLNWRNELKAGREPVVGPRQGKAVLWTIRLELLVLLFLPLLATLMARGYDLNALGITFSP